MSISDPPPPTPPGPPPASTDKRSGCLTALMAIFGIFMLLPGLCALLFGGMSVFEDGRIASDIAPLVFSRCAPCHQKSPGPILGKV